MRKRGKSRKTCLDSLPQALIKAEYLAGATTPTLSAKYGVATTSILKILRKLGVEIRAQGTVYILNDAMIEKAKKLRDSGMGGRAVAEALGVGFEALYAKVDFRHKKLPPEEICMLYAEGKPAREIGALYGVSHTTILRLLDRVGMRIRPQGHLPHQGKDHEDMLEPLHGLLNTLKKFRETDRGRAQSATIDPQIRSLQYLLSGGGLL